MCACLLAWGASAYAQQGTEMQTIWRCVDGSNRTHVTNVKDETTGKDCKIIQQQRVTVVSPPPLPQKGAGNSPKTASPASFPRETQADRANFKDRQRQTLESELSSEESLLAKAKAELVQQETLRASDPASAGRAQERLQKYRDNVQLHEKNVQELRKEIGKLR